LAVPIDQRKTRKPTTAATPRDEEAPGNTNYASGRMTRTTASGGGGGTNKKVVVAKKAAAVPFGGQKQKGAKHLSRRDRRRAKSKPSTAAVAEDTRLVITKEYIKSLPLRQWEGDVKILHTREEMAAAVEDITLLQKKQQTTTAASTTFCVGFDIESKPAFRKGQFHPPALLQIATVDVVYLFRLCALWHGKHGHRKQAHVVNVETFAFLRPLLTDGRILKAGVGVTHDVSNLKSLVGDYTPQGMYELADVAKEYIRSGPSLQALTAHYLHCQLPKTKRITMSDWARTDALSSDQIKYAATDAWAGLAIWRAMHEQQQREGGETPTVL
jgi:ribonuclease D